MQKINIAVITDNRADLLYNILEDLDKNKYAIYEFGSKNDSGVFEKVGKKCFFEVKNGISSILAIIFYLPIFLFCIIKLSKIKIKKSINILIISAYTEKIFMTPAAKILKIQAIWVEKPGELCRQQKKPLFFLYKYFSKKTRIITFTAHEAGLLSARKIKKENINVVVPGIRTKNYLRQDRIFSRLADSEENKFKKFFTIGTALELNSKQRTEMLFSAVQKSFTVIPQIQLIIIGDGLERKNLSWLAKKMGIDGLVWFVGEQAFFRKWADSFDLYAVACDQFTFHDINYILQAMSAGLPIVSPPMPALDEFVGHLNNGLITETDDSEALAQAIIKLQQNQELRKKLGEEGKISVDNIYNLDKMVERFEKAILSN